MMALYLKNVRKVQLENRFCYSAKSFFETFVLTPSLSCLLFVLLEINVIFRGNSLILVNKHKSSIGAMKQLDFVFE